MAASIKSQTPNQTTKAFIEKIVANASVVKSYSKNNCVLVGSKKKYSLDHSACTNKENISVKNLTYFISPRSSSEQIFKNIKNMAKNNTVLSPKPLLNNSNSINKDASQDKENFFLKYLKETNENNKKKDICEKNINTEELKRGKNTTEIMESLESLKNKYKTLKEMNFLKSNKNTEMICPSKFSKVALNPSSKTRAQVVSNEEIVKNMTQNRENSTNNTLDENSKKSNGTRKNNSGNMSNILSTNSNSESEIQQKSNEKELKNVELHSIKEKSNITEVFQKNMAMYKLNKDCVKKIFQNLAQKTPYNQIFPRNLSIPENNLHPLDIKKHPSRRNSFHCETEKKQEIKPISASENLINILDRTKKMVSCYKLKEKMWRDEKQELHSQIEELKKRLSRYEIL